MNMKAQTFKINGSKALLKAIDVELTTLGYNITLNSSTINPQYIAGNYPFANKDDFKSLFWGNILGDWDKTFELPKQYNEALTFAKEQLLDKYWIVEPKFKVGDYITSEGVYKGHIGRITKLVTTEWGSIRYHYWGFKPLTFDFKEDDDNYCIISPEDRLATPKEIEEFLIKVAKLKGFKTGSLVQRPSNFRIGTTPSTINVEYHGYTSNNDSLLFSNTTVYQKGVWGTIIPEPELVVKEFVLPDKWCIKDGQNIIVSEWFTKNSQSGSPFTGTTNRVFHYPMVNNAHLKDEVKDGYVLITLEQFKKYVIKKGAVTKLPFGNLEFTINKKLNTAKSFQGVITKSEIKEIVDWFNKDFTLLGHNMQIVNEGEWYLKFGCCKGTLAEAKAILKAFD